MGVRLYNPATGRFLQVDPVYGGNANDYDYCNADPINCTDLDGRFGWRKWLKRAAVVGGIVGALACGASVICGVAVGAAAGLGAYAAMHAGTSSWSYKRAFVSTAVGAASGLGLGRFGRVLKNGNNFFRAGRAGQYNHFRISAGPAKRHWGRLGSVGRKLFRYHLHIDRRYGGIDNWAKGKNHTWWRRY